MMNPELFGAPTPSTQVHGFPLPPEDPKRTPPIYSGGRYVVPHPITGKPNEKFTRVTTGSHVLDNQTGLDVWKMSNVVLGLKQEPDLLDTIDLFDEPSMVKRRVRHVAERASELAGSKEAAELGTAIHAWTEAVESGTHTIDQIPPQFRPYIHAYLRTLQEWGMRTVPGMIERVVFNATTGWVGTFDRIYELADGTYAIGDVKTSKSLSYSLLGFSAQIADYATATHMLDFDGKTWGPMPEGIRQDFGVIMHLPSNNPGHCEAVTIDIGFGVEVLSLAMEIMAKQRAAGKQVAGQHQVPPPGLKRKIQLAQTPEELGLLWETHQRGWSDEHTQLGMQRIRELQQK